jgi:polynucleotide 5'-hydroxyl-kinase GRC3/NOL9
MDTSSQTFACSTFHPDLTNFCPSVDARSVSIIIDKGESIVFIGSCQIELCAGSVEVNGYIMNDKNRGPFPLYSPKSTSLLSVNCLERETRLIFSSFNTNLQVQLPEHFAHENSHFIEGCSFIFSPLENFYSFNADKDWLYSLKALISTLPIVLVTGPRKVGKSTFCRWLTNRLLNTIPEVAFLNLDPSQTEFSPPGMLDLQIVNRPLLGPPFTHLALQPEKSFFYGNIQSSDDPYSYLKFSFALFEHYHSHKPNVPLVINTMGWTTGLGAEILRHFIEKFNLTDIIAFREDQSITENQLEYLLPSQSFKRFDLKSFRTNSQHPPRVSFCNADNNRPKKCTPRTFRETCFYFYFNGSFNDSFSFSILSQKTPYAVPMSALTAIKEIGCKMPKNIFLLNALNLAVVGLYRGDCCLGQGIIRGIDAKSKVLYIISPLPFEIIKQVNILVKGVLEIPLGMLSEEPHVPYSSASHSDSVLGQASLCNRPNLKRKKFSSTNR